MKPVRCILAFALVMVLALTGGSCSTSPRTSVSQLLGPRPLVESAPRPDSPANLLRLLEWCWIHRDVARYHELFTDDFRFVFSALDPAGNAWRDQPWTREDEIEAFTHLVNGGGPDQPPAIGITLLLDRNFRITDDPTPGKVAPWYRTIRTSVSMRVRADQERDISGYANFFMVRGDSALIPADLIARGFRPDSTRWYIERWEDDTFQEAGARARALYSNPASRRGR